MKNLNKKCGTIPCPECPFHKYHDLCIFCNSEETFDQAIQRVEGYIKEIREEGKSNATRSDV